MRTSVAQQPNGCMQVEPLHAMLFRVLHLMQQRSPWATSNASLLSKSAPGSGAWSAVERHSTTGVAHNPGQLHLVMLGQEAQVSNFELDGVGDRIKHPADAIPRAVGVAAA